MATEGKRIKDFLKRLSTLSENISKKLEGWMPNVCEKLSANLNEATKYSVLAGGKRIRPALCVLVANGFGYNEEAVYRAGCAYELIHTYSLIHDDLPAMDDDDLRRGKPTNHKIFGEATAILAGDSLLTMSFAWFASLIDYGVSPDKIVKIIKIATDMAGHEGMIGGQMLDLTNENKELDQDLMERIDTGKTSALICGPIMTGAILAGASDAELERLKGYAFKIGLLFQIVDDILDIEGDVASLGKNTGRDKELGKATYPSLLGLEGAKKYAKQICSEAIDALGPLAEKIPELEDFAKYLLNRKS